MKTTKPKSPRLSSAPPPRLIFTNLPDHYGPPMTFPELVAALAGQQGNPAVRALVQLMRHQMGAARQHELLPSTAPGERDYGSGGAVSAETLLTWTHLLVGRQVDAPQLGELRGQFPAPEKAQGQGSGTTN